MGDPSIIPRMHERGDFPRPARTDGITVIVRPCRPHADYIDFRNFPNCWKKGAMTVDVVAKAKELTVLRLMADPVS